MLHDSFVAGEICVDRSSFCVSFELGILQSSVSVFVFGWVYSLKFFGSFWSIISTALHLILISRTFRQVICIDYGAVVSFALHFGDNLPACLQKCVPKFVLVQ